MSEKTFKSVMDESLEVDGSVIKARLSDEAKAALATVKNLADLDMHMSGPMSSIKITDALTVEAALNSAAKDPQLGIVADKLAFNNLAGETVTFDCAVAKMSNVHTSEIVDASVEKAYVECNIREDKLATTMNTTLRTDFKFSYEKPQVQNGEDGIIRRSTLNDMSLSATIMLDDLRLSDELVKILDSQHKLKETMIAESLQEMSGKLNAGQLLSVYRNINKSATDHIYELEWTVLMGERDIANNDQVVAYNNAKKQFHAGLATIGSPTGLKTIQFGLRMTSLSISQEKKWSNRTKLSTLHRFGQHSYYVRGNVDTGYQRIPVTEAVLKRHANEIDEITAAALKWIEAEVRSELGYEVSAEVPNVPERNHVATAEYYRLLNITKEQENQILSELDSCAHELARKVIEAARENRAMEVLDRGSLF